MRGAKDPPPPLDHVLHDALGFEQVVACVEISLLASNRNLLVLVPTQVVTGALGVAHEGHG